MSKWFVLAALAGCGSPAIPAPRPVRRPAPVATLGPTVERRVAISLSRVSGSLVTTTAADGTIHAVLDVVENGRGPHVDATLTLAADGTIASFEAIGHHEMGTPLAETFARAGTHATWHSAEETGDQQVSGPAFYVPMSDLPALGWLVPAALRLGGTIALLPGGEAHVEQVAELELRGQVLRCYAVSGLDLTPSYTWFWADGRWFGSVDSWESVVPDGWEAAIEPLLKRQHEVDDARAAELAKQTAHRPPAAGLAYTHARVLDVEHRRWLADQTVLVVGDTIAAVGTRVPVPAGAEVVDLTGKALLPGLIDMHSHLFAADGPLDIASGVTTARDVGNDPDELDDMKARFDAGAAVGPSVVRMGFIEGRNPKAASSKVTAETPDEARAAVEFYARRGYDGIKIYNSVRVELVPLLAATAHARGMLVTGHIPVHMLAHEAIDAGYDGIEHINMLFLNFFATHETDTRDTTRFTLVGDRAADFDLNGKPMGELVAQLLAKHTVVDPTLVAFEDLFAGVSGTVTPGLEATVARFPLQVQREFLVGGLATTPVQRERYLRSWNKMLAMVKALWQAKVALVVGTDAIAGLMLQHELALYVRAGIPPADVLRMATLDAARAMRLDAKIGSIAAGKRADLFVVDGDPLVDILALQKVESTMRAGISYAAAPLYRAVGVRP